MSAATGNPGIQGHLLLAVGQASVGELAAMVNPGVQGQFQRTQAGTPYSESAVWKIQRYIEILVRSHAMHGTTLSREQW